MRNSFIYKKNNQLLREKHITTQDDSCIEPFKNLVESFKEKGTARGYDINSQSKIDDKLHYLVEVSIDIKKDRHDFELLITENQLDDVQQFLKSIFK